MRNEHKLGHFLYNFCAKVGYKFQAQKFQLGFTSLLTLATFYVIVISILDFLGSLADL